MVQNATTSAETTKSSVLSSVVKETETVWVSTPDSSVFTKIGYNETEEILLVVFRDSGMTYEYEGFPKGEWDDFIAADSKGKWYNAEIKPYYDYSDKY